MSMQDVHVAGADPDPLPGGEGYAVKLQVFEGPLDLLLHLIRQNEVEEVFSPPPITWCALPHRAQPQPAAPRPPTSLFCSPPDQHPPAGRSQPLCSLGLSLCGSLAALPRAYGVAGEWKAALPCPTSVPTDWHAHIPLRVRKEGRSQRKRRCEDGGGGVTERVIWGHFFFIAAIDVSRREGPGPTQNLHFCTWEDFFL